MATLSPELVTQRASAVAVAIQANRTDTAAGENIWSATSANSRDQVVTKTVAGNQAVRGDIDTRLGG